MHLWIPYQRGKFNWRNLVRFAATGLVLGFLRMVRLVGNVIYWCWVGFHFISDHFVVGWNDFDFPILAKKSGKSYARIPKLEVQDEQHCHCCTRQATHPCSVSEGSRTHACIPTSVSRMSQQTSPVGRWSRPEPVLPFGGQQTYRKIEPRCY